MDLLRTKISSNAIAKTVSSGPDSSRYGGLAGAEFGEDEIEHLPLVHRGAARQVRGGPG
jgi:hypothetical protein